MAQDRRKIREAELKKLMDLAEEDDLAELTDVQVDNLISVLGRTACSRELGKRWSKRTRRR